MKRELKIYGNLKTFFRCKESLIEPKTRRFKTMLRNYFYHKFILLLRKKENIKKLFSDLSYKDFVLLYIDLLSNYFEIASYSFENESEKLDFIYKHKNFCDNYLNINRTKFQLIVIIQSE